MALAPIQVAGRCSSVKHRAEPLRTTATHPCATTVCHWPAPRYGGCTLNAKEPHMTMAVYSVSYVPVRDAEAFQAYRTDGRQHHGVGSKNAAVSEAHTVRGQGLHDGAEAQLDIAKKQQ